MHLMHVSASKEGPRIARSGLKAASSSMGTFGPAVEQWANPSCLTLAAQASANERSKSMTRTLISSAMVQNPRLSAFSCQQSDTATDTHRQTLTFTTEAQRAQRTTRS